MNIMTKRGRLDNIVTYEHICDTVADLPNIPKNQTTLGSTAIVLKGTNDMLEVYLADSDGEWISIITSGGGGDIDLSQDTVDVLHLVEGYTAHDHTGASITGTVPIRTVEDLVVSGDVITVPGGYYAAATTINTPPTKFKNLNLVDYNGTLLHAYTTAEALELTALPDPPTHTGLTAYPDMKWNYELSVIKTFFNRYPTAQFFIGPQYLTMGHISGYYDTEIDIEILDDQYTSPYLCFDLTGAVEINWGDGTPVDTYTNVSMDKIYANHTYNVATQRKFTIHIEVISGSIRFQYSSTPSKILISSSANDASNVSADRLYTSYIKSIRLGTASIGTYAFDGLDNLETLVLTLPTSFYANDTFVPFGSTPKLKALIVPSSLTSSGNDYTYRYGYCGARIISLPVSLQNISGSTFFSNEQLEHLTLTPYLQSVSGVNAFYGCKKLKNLVISDISESYNNYVITNNGLLDGCKSLEYVELPSSKFGTETQSSFNNCESLQKIIIPEGVTSISSRTISNCTNLKLLILPSTVTSIETYGISDSGYKLKEMYVKATTPPTLSASSSMTTINQDCVIYVPYSADHSILSAYKSATNWTTYQYNMQEYQELTFTIDDVTYHAMPYMTWRDWCASTYNTDSFTINPSDNRIYKGNNCMFRIDSIAYNVYADDRIRGTATYSTEL